MDWFLTVGSSRITDGGMRGMTALRAGAGAASSDGSGRVLWAYGFWRCGSKSLTGALVAGVWGRRMAPGPWRCHTSGGAVLLAAARKPVLRRTAAAGFVGAGQGQVGSPRDDRRMPIIHPLGDRVARASEKISRAVTEASCIERPVR
jgi:hypothetical protein